MTYEAFKTTILDELKITFPPDTNIFVHPIPRNNDIALDGLTILESGFNIAPTIYMQDYYQKFCAGTPIKDIITELMNTYYECRPVENVNPAFFCDFEKVQNRIVYKLIHFQKNKSLLKEIPHIPYLDLAIVFYCLLDTNTTRQQDNMLEMNQNSYATILIRHSHLQLWNITENQLFLLARLNTPFLLASKCNKMSELLAPLLTNSSTENNLELEMNSDFTMYVLTNQNQLYGAACILYEDLLSDFAEQMQSDFYILPSSIHEVILVPAAPGMSNHLFNSMISEVNDSQLAADEILSDHVYYFSQKERCIQA